MILHSVCFENVIVKKFTLPLKFLLSSCLPIPGIGEGEGRGVWLMSIGPFYNFAFSSLALFQ